MCSLCKCKSCGAINEKKHLTKENTLLCRDDKIIQWKQWMTKTGVKKYYAEGFEVQINSKSKEGQSLSKVFMIGTQLRLLSYYTDLLKDMSFHHFNNCWQMHQFMLCQSNLQKSQIMIIQDFAHNFVIDFQDEPKMLHWSHDQVTVHLTVCMFACRQIGCSKLVTVEVIHVSMDLKYDPHAVAMYKKDTLDYIRKLGVPFEEVIEWTHQAPTQYKSIHVFINMMNSDIPMCHHYYPIKHGKNPEDGASGRVKLAFKRGKLSCETTIRNARELYEYASQAMDNCSADNNSCNHFRTKIMFKGKN